MGCQFSVVCCLISSLTPAQSTASLGGAFSFALHHGPEVVPVSPRGRIWTTCALLGRRGWTNSTTRISGACKDNWVTPLFSVLTAPLLTSHLLLHRGSSSRVSLGLCHQQSRTRSLFAACSQTLTVMTPTSRHTLCLISWCSCTGRRWLWDFSQSPFSFFFNPLLKVTPPIKHIVCILSEWACTHLGFTGIGTCLEFCMYSFLLCHKWEW